MFNLELLLIVDYLMKKSKQSFIYFLISYRDYLKIEI